MTRLDLALALSLGVTLAAPLALSAAPATARADEPEEEPEPPPPPKAKPTAEELMARLERNKITVDWKDESALDAINEVQQKSGVKFAYDQALADFAAKRKVTYDGYSVRASEAIERLRKVLGFTLEPDAEAGVIHLRLDPAAPTRAALADKRMKVAWKEILVSAAITDIEKKTGVKVQLHPTIKSRLSSRRISWESDEATAREAIETLYVLPPPSVPGRLVIKPGMVVLVLYDGPAENKADIDLYLDEKRVTLALADAPPDELAKLLTTALSVPVEVEKRLSAEGKKVTLEATDIAPRAALERAAKSAGFSWKVEGKKIVLRSLEKK